jgi:LuxR family maltose regulon positive regulatory protein
MDSTLLHTKLAIPLYRQGLVARRRLLTRLDQGLAPGCRLVLVSAPAGYGKTTLVSEWLAASPALRPAWLALDEADNDPLRFMRYLRAALQTVNPDLGRAVVALEEGFLRPDRSLEPFLLALINAIAALPELVLLVLDDLHMIEAPEVYRLLAFLVDHQPENLRLLVTTRSDPALPLARLRARRQLVEIRLTDLRFTREEASAFLAEILALPLTPRQVADLEKRTEGWAAGLQLVGVALHSLAAQDEADRIPAFIETFSGSNRYILEYLVEEVFNRQTEPIQNFLTATCILNRMNGALCDALTGGSDGSATLQTLERANLFVVPLDTAHTWFRYHPLFAEFLRTRTHVTDLHRRASAWFEAQGLPEDALEHARQGQDFERLIRLIEQMRRMILIPGEMSRLARYLEVLSPEQICSRPLLCLTQAWCYLYSGRLAEIEAFIQSAVTMAGPQDAIIGGEAAALRAMVAILAGNYAQAVTEAAQALARLPANDIFLRAWLNLGLGMASDVLGDLGSAEKAFMHALADGRSLSGPIISTMALTELGDMRLRQGRLSEAIEFFRQAIESSIAHGQPTLASGIACSRLGRLYYEWNDLAAAATELELAIDLGHFWEGGDICLFSLSYLAWVRFAQGDLPAVRNLVAEARKIMRGAIISSPTVRVAQALLTRLALRLGQRLAVETWEREVTAQPEGSPFLKEIEETTRIRILLARRDGAAALARIEPLIALAQREGRGGNLVELLTLRALVLAQIDRPAEARATLRQSLALAEPEGFVRSFADEGPAMLALLETSAQHAGMDWRYLSVLRQAFGPSLSSTPSVARPDGLVEPLTQRELEILRLIDQGCSNQDIARRLVVSVSTVKTHINNLYGKLGAQTRTTALARAREFKLLS